MAVVVMVSPAVGCLSRFLRRNRQLQSVHFCHNRAKRTRIGHLTINLADITLTPPVLLAPLAGITDLPFRRMVSEFGAGLVVSEMVASQEIVQAKPQARERAELGFDARDRANTAVQIAGREAYWMGEAARMIEANGARIIDINMGCPSKKMVSGLAGSALLRDLDMALELIDAVVGAVDIPVTLKTRLGWDDARLNAPELARRAQDAGIKMITVHGRTRCQFYKGCADWAAIARVKQAVDIPVVANGDIIDVATAARALAESGANGVMVGRGAQGAPWRLARIAADIYDTPAPDIPTGAALADLVARHYDAMLSYYGGKTGNRMARKHLGWYMDGVDTPAPLRKEILTAPDPARVFKCLPAAFDRPKKEAA
jgi:nifR3 family TIM-barrel protein